MLTSLNYESKQILKFRKSWTTFHLLKGRRRTSSARNSGRASELSARKYNGVSQNGHSEKLTDRVSRIELA